MKVKIKNKLQNNQICQSFKNGAVRLLKILIVDTYMDQKNEINSSVIQYMREKRE